MPNICSKTSLNSVFIGTLHPFILMCNLTDTFDICLFLHGSDSFAAPLLPYCRRLRHSHEHSQRHSLGRSHGHSQRHSQPGPSDRGRAGFAYLRSCLGLLPELCRQCRVTEVVTFSKNRNRNRYPNARKARLTLYCYSLCYK